MLTVLYATVLFLSAILLFWIEPLFSKMALPLLGGSPSVWTTALMFFQLVLLAGYGYAHLLNRLLAPRQQVWLHAMVALASLAFLPIGLAPDSAPSGQSPVFWLTGLLAISLGLPFFTLAATAPLLQSWFSRTGDRRGADPYFLYAASNAGSLLALLAFPLALEPMLTVGQQSRLWSLLYALLLLLVLICAVPARHARLLQPAGTLSERPKWQDQLIWVALAAVPSSLMLGVTTYITTDVASAPLLWIIPLGLYLITFIIAFGQTNRLRADWLARAQAIGLVMVALLLTIGILFGRSIPTTILMATHLATFFVTALLCHTELARRRPNSGAITQYYFCLSIGGALGGMFNALLAPVLLPANYEYCLGLVAAAALRAFIAHKAGRPNVGDVIWPLLLGGLLVVGIFVFGNGYDIAPGPRLVVLMVCTLPVYSFSERPIRFAFGLAALLTAAIGLDSSIGVLYQDRTFFGVNRVKQVEHGAANVMMHGTTLHGTEYTAPAEWREPLGYYARSGPAGQLLATRSDTRNVILIGLGAGALSCYRQPGQHWQLFELDPAVVRIARDSRFFHYLSECAGDSPVVLGDGRLTLQGVADGSQDIIIVDAFSSDSIPLHLLTREAIGLYLRKLGNGGTVLLHISNRYLALAPVVATLAADAGISAKDELYSPSAAEEQKGAGASEWIALARHPTDLDFLDARWTSLTPPRNGRPWTDDFSNIVGALRW